MDEAKSKYEMKNGKEEESAVSGLLRMFLFETMLQHSVVADAYSDAFCDFIKVFRCIVIIVGVC